jgi:hypothetical protein
MNEECSVCSTVSSALQCGHWSCRVCNYKVVSLRETEQSKIAIVKSPSNQMIMYMECDKCKNHTTLNENEQLYILYVERTHTK